MQKYLSSVMVLGLFSCKTVNPSETSKLQNKSEIQPLGEYKIDWSTHSELTSAPIVQSSCKLGKCPTNAQFELQLEKEFWRHVHLEDFAGMDAWLEKTKTYVELSSERDQRPLQISRLTKLMAFGHGMMLIKYDLHRLVPDLNDILQSKDLNSVGPKIKSILVHPALKHLLMGLGHAIDANKLNRKDLHGQTVLLVMGSFAQATLPPQLFGFQGLTGVNAYKSSMFGPTCKDISPEHQQIFFGGLCYENGLMGPGGDAFKKCVDKKTCENIGTGTEGLLAGAMSLVMLHSHVGARRMLTMLGDGPGEKDVALCKTYWCGFTSPNDPAARIPEATGLTPFKKIGSLLAIAEAYGKVGQLAKMEVVLKATREEALRLNYPFMNFIDRVEASLKGGNRSKGIPDMLKSWENPDPRKDILGAVQFPLPISGREGNCVSCHYGGVLPDSVRY